MVRKKTKQSWAKEEQSNHSGKRKANCQWRKIFRFVTTSLGSAAIVAVTLYLMSRYVFCPSLLVKISKTELSQQGLLAYDVSISNPSNYIISRLSFTFKFDDRYPIKHLSIKDITCESGIKVYNDFRVEKVTPEGEKIVWLPLVSGFSGGANNLMPGSGAHISILLDVTYNGDKGDVFPNSSGVALKNNSYLIGYSYTPFGVLSSFPIKVGGIYDFTGKRTRADNSRSYTQKWQLPNGRIIPITCTAIPDKNNSMPIDRGAGSVQNIYVFLPEIDRPPVPEKPLQDKAPKNPQNAP